MMDMFTKEELKQFLLAEIRASGVVRQEDVARRYVEHSGTAMLEELLQEGHLVELRYRSPIESEARRMFFLKGTEFKI